MHKFHIDDYLRLGKENCFFAADDPLLHGLHLATNSNICEAGCAFFEGGKCRGFQILMLGKCKGKKTQRKTNAEIAEERGITKRQVAKLRKKNML